MLMGLSAALLFFASCMKDKPRALPEKLLWNPQLALPLGEEMFGMNGESGFDTLLLEEDTISGQPEWLGEHKVVMEGEYDFDPSTISDNLDKLRRILFRLNCSSQFPHTIYSQAYFHDGSGNVIDSMFREGPVETPAAIVRDQGNIIEAGKAQHDAIIEGDRLPALANTQLILFRSGFIVADVDSLLIPAYPTFEFHIDSGMMLDLSFEN